LILQRTLHRYICFEQGLTDER